MILNSFARCATPHICVKERESYAAGIATIIFKPFFQRIGRKGVMISGGVAFVVGAALQAGAVNMGMLIIGRLFLGLGIGFANQVSKGPGLRVYC
jgi:predicted MFS family arabinose efflux permease